MATKPAIEWIGSPNFWKGRDGYGAIAIVDHITQDNDNPASVDGEFLNPKAQVSAHFMVRRDGVIHQYVNDFDTAWGNGPMNNPDLSVPWIADCYKNGINPNYRTISIEHDGNTGEEFTEAQYQATLALHKYLCDRWGIPRDRNHIVGHYQIDSINRPFCPGKAFPWNRLMEDLKVEVAYSPDMYNLGVGDGVKAELAQDHDVASSPELWGHFSDGSEKSLTKSFGSRLYLTEKNPDGTFTTTVYQKIR